MTLRPGFNEVGCPFHFEAETPLQVIGHTISHYRVIEKLGVLDVVYKAEDTRLYRFVALILP
jgi:hypothetical protein